MPIIGGFMEVCVLLNLKNVMCVLHVVCMCLCVDYAYQARLQHTDRMILRWKSWTRQLLLTSLNYLREPSLKLRNVSTKTRTSWMPFLIRQQLPRGCDGKTFWNVQQRQDHHEWPAWCVSSAHPESTSQSHIHIVMWLGCGTGGATMNNIKTLSYVSFLGGCHISAWKQKPRNVPCP